MWWSYTRENTTIVRSHRDFLREKRDLGKPGEEEGETLEEGEKAALVVELATALEEEEEEEEERRAAVPEVELEVREDFPAS